MTSRRDILTVFSLGTLAAPLAAFSQQSRVKVATIGFLGAASASAYASRIEALRAGLRELGYVEGRNIVIDSRWANGIYKRLDELAAELVKLRVDVLVTHGTPGTLAAKRATTTIPIVMAVSGDAVSTGIVASLARPEGNVTGSTFFSVDLTAKRLELLKEAIPRTKRVGILSNPDNPIMEPTLKMAGVIAKSLELAIQRIDARTSEEIESAFAASKKNRIDAIVLPDDAFFVSNAEPIANLALKNRLPIIGFVEFVDAGGLMYYGVNQLAMWRHAAVFVDKILKGAKPVDLPVEQATKFEMVINLKSARLIGVRISKTVMLRADRVIE